MNISIPEEWFIGGIAALWVYSAAVAALPPPTDKSTAFYRWAYKFLKIIAGDLSGKFGSYMPPSANPTQPKEQ